MRPITWLLLGLVAALALAGCSFKSSGGGGDGGGTLSVSGGNTNENDNKDSPAAGLWETGVVLGCALLARRRLAP